jgi:hypothetical protein
MRGGFEPDWMRAETMNERLVGKVSTYKKASEALSANPWSVFILAFHQGLWTPQNRFCNSGKRSNFRQ